MVAENSVIGDGPPIGVSTTTRTGSEGIPIVASWMTHALIPQTHGDENSKHPVAGSALKN
jgi:hypothetical protein